MAMSSLASKLSTTSFALARNVSSKGQMVKQVCFEMKELRLNLEEEFDLKGEKCFI